MTGRWLLTGATKNLTGLQDLLGLVCLVLKKEKNTLPLRALIQKVKSSQKYTLYNIYT